ncbi:PEGA domain-containing protein [Deinococcus murrayi]|uniref:PEGA domain-containing protein n=1 Tax=Deinococcus murrayi TaxID=68910 RepID=UPI0005523C11|nr:PEGA domain-containing protein [Deinococcus murrayi]
MKPIGPYVAARDLGGDPTAPASVRTLRATDRLTGMPVLLHVLPHAAPLPELPDSPALLRPAEGGVDGETVYVVTELPPHAHPARDPLLAARGGLEALAALHAAGLTHGGVSAAQLWSVDGQVALAGAGLPWGGDPTPAGDVRALLAALETLGELPASLRGAGEDATAADLLARLNAPAEVPPLRVPPPAEAAEPDAPPPPPAPPAEAAKEVGEGTAAPAPANTPLPPRPTSRRRLSEDVRITWNPDGTRRVVKPGQEARRGSRRPAWLWPLLALLVLLALAAALWAWRSGGGGDATTATRTAAPAPACCPLTFAVQGEAPGPVRLSVVRAPAGAGLKAGAEVGTAPGEVTLPAPGEYVLRVAADGYAPAEVTVTAPSAVPVTIDLAP